MLVPVGSHNKFISNRHGEEGKINKLYGHKHILSVNKNYINDNIIIS